MILLPLVAALTLGQTQIIDETTDLGRPWTLRLTGAGVTCSATGGIPKDVTCVITSGGGGGAPTTATYWTGSADATLSAEHNLGALGTGLVLNTGGTPSAYGGTGAPPANQWLRQLSAAGVGTWAQVDWADLSGKPATFPATTPVATASALAADPTACGAGTYVSDISAAGALTCGTPAGTYTLPDAAAGTTGGLRLTGQLGGTATSPTVTGLTCTGCVGATQAAALDAGDTTTGTFAAARIPSAAAATIGGVELDTDLGGTAAGPNVVATHLASPLPGAQGGGGAALPTCAGTDKLTSNGTTWSCAADVGGTYTLPALTATVLGGVKGNGATLLCSGTDKMTGFDAAGAMQCAADSGAGGGMSLAQVEVATVTAFGRF